MLHLLDLDDEKQQLGTLCERFNDEEACFKRLFKTTIEMILITDDNNRLHIDNYINRIEEVRKINKNTFRYQDENVLSHKTPLRLVDSNIDNILSRSTHFTTNNMIIHGKNENIIKNNTPRGTVSWENTNFKNKLAVSLYYKLLLKIHFEGLKYYSSLYHIRLNAIHVYRVNKSICCTQICIYI